MCADFKPGQALLKMPLLTAQFVKTIGARKALLNAVEELAGTRRTRSRDEGATPMNDVTKAAERLRRFRDSGAIEIRGSTYDGGMGQYDVDVDDVLAWALPLLDTELITEDRLRAVGFSQREGCERKYLQVDVIDGDNYKHIHVDDLLSLPRKPRWNLRGGSSNNITIQSFPKTMGDVFMAARLLGIPLTEPAERP